MITKTGGIGDDFDGIILNAPTGRPVYEWTESDRQSAASFARELAARELSDSETQGG